MQSRTTVYILPIQARPCFSLPAFVGVLQLNTLDSPLGIPRNHSLGVPVEQKQTIKVKTKPGRCYKTIR